VGASAEVEESPANQDDADDEVVVEVAEEAAYQAAEEAEAAAEEDPSIEERVRRIQDVFDVPESPVGEPSSSINRGLTSHPPASPTSTVREGSSPPIVGPATCPPAPEMLPETPRESTPLLRRSNSVRVKRRLLERWRSLAAIQARQSALRSFSNLMRQLDVGY
jgi:hypothetical protein